MSTGERISGLGRLSNSIGRPVKRPGLSVEHPKIARHLADDLRPTLFGWPGTMAGNPFVPHFVR